MEEHAHAARTLFILDGLDEVSQDLSGEDRMSRFLKELLDQPNVIITSRPYVLPPGLLKPLDLELETIGFYPKQVTEYLDKDPRRPTRKSTRSCHFSNIINSFKALFGSLFSWMHSVSPGTKGVEFRTKLDTMTCIYQAIEQRLWKKDILRLEMRHNVELVTEASDPIGWPVNN